MPILICFLVTEVGKAAGIPVEIPLLVWFFALLITVFDLIAKTAGTK